MARYTRSSRMRITLEELGHALFGHAFGAWYWVPNRQTVHPKLLTRWDPEPGDHPFVLIRDHTGGPSVPVRARSLSDRTGAPHGAHPPDHARTCKIRDDGRIVRRAWALSTEALSSRNFSCREPDDRLDALRRILGVG